jgi:hypothetical protein
MSRPFVIAVLALPFAASVALALATDQKGNAPLHAANYMTWKGIMPVINDKARVYTVWCNGSESFYYKGGVKELNDALQHFAKVEVKHHVVVLRPGPATAVSFDKETIAFDWEMHVMGGIARRFATDKPDDLDSQKDPVLTIHVTDRIDLSKLKLPKGVTLKSAPARSDAGKKNTAASKKIAAFMERMKTEPKP